MHMAYTDEICTRYSNNVQILIHGVHMGVHGCTWMYMGVHEYPWVGVVYGCVGYWPHVVM